MNRVPGARARRRLHARHRLGEATVVLLAAGLVACASVPEPEAGLSPLLLPSAWSATGVHQTGAATLLTQWWRRFDDPLLTRLVNQALAHNTSLAGAQAALRQARALRDLAAASLSPSVSGQASAQRTRASEQNSNSFQLGLDAGWELDLFGANQYGLDAGNASLRASAASLGAAQISVAAEVALDYISLRSLQQRLLIAANTLASQEQTLGMAQWRLQTGLYSELEAQQARSAAAQTRAQLPLLANSISQMQHALAVLTGVAPASLQAEWAPVAALPQVVDELALNIPAETLRQRPDVRVAEQNLLAAGSLVAQAQARRAPDFRLGGSLGLGSAALGALTHSASVLASLLAAVSVPLLDGGALRAQVRSQQATQDQARAAYQTTVLTALQEVEDALTSLRTDRERVLSLTVAAQAAGSAAELAGMRFESGVVDFALVLETQRSQYSTQDNLALARAATSTDHVRLVKALGGGWTP